MPAATALMYHDPRHPYTAYRSPGVSLPPMRPTFELRVHQSRDEVLRALRALPDDERFKAAATQDHLTITVSDPHRHFWSPWLTVECHPDDDPSASRVEARFSPHPAIWTGVALTFIALATIAFFAAMFAAAQWMTDHTPSALYALALAALGAAALYWVSQVGKKLANDQMHDIHDAVTNALTKGSPPPDTP